MVRQTKKIIIPIFTLAFMQILSILYAGYGNRSADQPNEVAIILKATNLVVGNQIILGDICEINIPNSELKKRVSQINIGLAPPPGESIELPLTQIIKKVTVAGFSKYTAFISGPKTIRVETAHREIEKAFLQEEFALNYMTFADTDVKKKV